MSDDLFAGLAPASWQVWLQNFVEGGPVGLAEKAEKAGAPREVIEEAWRVRRQQDAENEHKDSAAQAGPAPDSGKAATALGVTTSSPSGSPEAAPVESLLRPGAPKVGADGVSLADPPPLVWDRRRQGRRPAGVVVDLAAVVAKQADAVSSPKCNSAA
jgi:hypothetical protein